MGERVFNSFEFENEYYRSVQFEVFSQLLRCFHALDEKPTFLKLHQVLSDPAGLFQRIESLEGADSEKRWLRFFKDLSLKDRTQQTSGLSAALSHFAYGSKAQLYNCEESSFTFEEALEKNLIVYIQLPVLLAPFLGRATGKLILQCLQSAIANRHRGSVDTRSFFSVFLDDFTEYLYPGFVTILNKSRSANIGVVFAHQALGDIKTLGDAIANSILTNANLKIFMRGNDPDSAEYFAKVIGTESSTKYTERTTTGLFGHDRERTGEASAREVEEFVVHPNMFKSELGIGQAVMIVPHARGSRAVQIKFQKFDDLPAPPPEFIAKVVANTLADGSQPIQSKERLSNEKTDQRVLISNRHTPYCIDAPDDIIRMRDSE